MEVLVRGWISQIVNLTCLCQLHCLLSLLIFIQFFVQNCSCRCMLCWGLMILIHISAINSSYKSLWAWVNLGPQLCWILYFAAGFSGKHLISFYASCGLGVVLQGDAFMKLVALAGYNFLICCKKELFLWSEGGWTYFSSKIRFPSLIIHLSKGSKPVEAVATQFWTLLLLTKDSIYVCFRSRYELLCILSKFLLCRFLCIW